jgi:UDP-glucose 4-epimerase
MLTGVLGGAGFIGSYLCQQIVAQPGLKLRLLVRNATRTPPVSSAEVFTGDLLSRADCERFVAGLDVIYYLAHTNTPITSDNDRATDAALNLVPLLNLLDVVRRTGSRSHIVYFSSGGAVYASRPIRAPFKESDPCAPNSSYGILKLTAESYLRLAAERGEASATVLRVGNAYGTLLPEHRMQGFIGVALNHLLHGNPVRVFGNPENVRDYIHLDDVCSAALRAAAPQRPFDIFNIGTGRGYSVQELLAVMRDRNGASFPIRNEAAPGRWLVDWVVLDSSRAREQLGWSASVDLPAGIARMLSTLRGQVNARSLSAP